jgi:hypothetical protein
LLVCAAVNVSVLVPVAVPLSVVGEKEAVTPVGKPEAVKVTVELKPPDGAMDTGRLVAEPDGTLATVEEGFSANEGLTIVSVVVAFATRFPPLAITVRVYVPTAAVFDAITVAVTEPEPGDATLLDDKLTVMPAGTPETVRVTADLNVPPAVTVVVNEAVPPVARLRVFGAFTAVRVAGPVPDVSVQWLTSNAASTEPNPLAWSYPVVAKNPFTPGTVLLPVVMS